MARPRSSGTIQPARSEAAVSDAAEEPGAGGRVQPAAVSDGALVLPSEPSVPSADLGTKTILIYGPPKIGKSTLASEFPDVLFFDLENGLKDLSVYRVPVHDWNTFGQACTAAIEDFQSGGRTKTVVIDTIDKLTLFCRQSVYKRLGVVHESDLEFGKGWDITQGAFTGAIAKLVASGLGLIMIAHSKSEEIKSRNQSWTKVSPAISPIGMRKAATSLSDLIICIDQGEVEDGDDIRMFFTKESKYVEAGERGMTPRLPETIPWPIGESGYGILSKAWESGT